MKRRVLVFIVGFLLIGTNLFAANGDLIVYNKLGVGNTAPTYKLDVTGDVRFTGTLMGGSVPWARLTTFPSACATGQFVRGVGATLTCATPSGSGVSGSGTASYVSKWTGTTSLGNSQIYDNGTNVGVGTTAPTYKLDVTGDVRFTGTLQGGSVPWARLNTYPTACTSGQYVSGIGSTLTCSTPAGGGGGLSGSGTANYMSKWTGTTSLGNSLIYDNGTNVGIGTTSPPYKFSINLSANQHIYFNQSSASNQAQLIFADQGTLKWGMGKQTDNTFFLYDTAASKTAFWAGGGNSGLAPDSASKVGIGTLSPGGKLTVKGPSGTPGSIQIDSAGQCQLEFLFNGVQRWGLIVADGGGGIGFYQWPGSVPFFITTANNIGIGTMYPSYQLQLSTDSAAKPSTNTWTIASDARLKTNIQSYTKGLKEIMQINPVTYKYNGKGGIGHNKFKFLDPASGVERETEVIDTELLAKTHVGVLAMDIQSVVPEAVSSHKGKLNKEDVEETDILDFNSHSLTFILINAVKELKAEIDSLQAQIADLKAQIK